MREPNADSAVPSSAARSIRELSEHPLPAELKPNAELSADPLADLLNRAACASDLAHQIEQGFLVVHPKDLDALVEHTNTILKDAA